MTQASYSFLDVAVLDEVRERFAAGDALAILSVDLDEVIWANGPGAALLGHQAVETIFGAETPLGSAAKRQIGSLRGFPEIGSNRPLMVRVTLGVASQALRFLASAVTLPDGERAILLAQPAAEDMRDKALRQAVGGFSEPGHVLAFIGEAGVAEAASSGFARLRLAADALAELARGTNATQRVVRHHLASRRGSLPVGLARLTDERFLLVAVDENQAEDDFEAEAAEATGAAGAAGAADAPREIWHLGSEGFLRTDAQAEDAPAENTAKEAEANETAPAVAAEAQDAVPPAVHAMPEPSVPVDAADEQPESMQAVEAEEERSEAPPEQLAAAGREPQQPPRGPVRFVWRTDATGKFSQISREFASAVGDEAADVLDRRFEDVARAFALDPSGDIAGLLTRRDTWSGRTIFWPIAGTDLRVPVDLAALPVYDRSRNFEGFRGFGVARMGDASVDPEGIGLALRSVPRPAGVAAKDGWEKAQVEKPAEAAPVEAEKGPSDKVIQLAEHRPAAPEKTQATGGEKVLSLGERLAFQQIGERLRQASEKAAGAKAADTKKPQAEVSETAYRQNGPSGPTSSGDTEEPRALDGLTETKQGETAAAASSAEPETRAPTEQHAPRRARGERPGMSLLGPSRSNGEEAASGTPSQPAARVEMEEAEAVEVRADDTPAVETIADEDADALSDNAAQDASGTDPDAILLGTDEAKDEIFAETDLEPVEPAVEQALEESETEAGVEALRAAQTTGENDNGLSILEKLPVAVLVHSGDVLHYGNEEFFALTGYNSIEALGEAGGIGALFADEADREPRPAGDRAGTGDNGSLRLTTAGGENVPVEAFLQSVPWGAGKALLLVLSRWRDGFGGQSPLVSELEARVAEMRTIIDTATDGVVLISREGNIRSISRPAEALFGMDGDDAEGKPFSSLFAMESQKAARDYLAGLSEHGVASVLNDGREVIGREAEGRFIPLFMTIGKLPGDSGFCAVVRDITQWKRAEEDLTQARSAAERASYHKSEFLARVSHEIRTPLNAIIGFSELMLDEKFGPVTNDRYRDYLRDINRSGNHVLDLVNDLLDISKIEAGQQEMSYEAVQLNEALAETVALMQPQANRERVIIRSSFASRLPDVVADLRSVRQIALNVLSNAVRYTQAGGQVIVSTAYESGGDVVLRVRDTGIGMTQAEIEQALKPFKQINSLKRPRGDGTGLGLPLTKAMVEANRARFSINSTPGEGTLVEVAFPSTRVLAE
jgi:PAS domain S-box-containing protein